MKNVILKGTALSLMLGAVALGNTRVEAMEEVFTFLADRPSNAEVRTRLSQKKFDPEERDLKECNSMPDFLKSLSDEERIITIYQTHNDEKFPILCELTSVEDFWREGKAKFPISAVQYRNSYSHHSSQQQYWGFDVIYTPRP